MKNKYLMDLQLFAVPENETTTTDLAPAISIDFTSRISENINTLMEILGVTEMTPMAAGTLIKLYTETVTVAEQVAEGETIGLSKVKRELAATKELGLGKYRKQVTAESIQKYGRDRAINRTDEKLIAEIRKGIKADFFNMVSMGTGTAPAGMNLQGALANVWAALQKKFVDTDGTPIYFVSTDDIAPYLANATITVQNAFGFTYVENFLGLGKTFVHPGLKAGEVAGTVIENLNGAYVPASGGDLAESFQLTGDESGFVGMTHQIATDNASITTLLFCSVLFFPELIDGVIKSTIGEAAGGDDGGDDGNDEGGEGTTTYTAVENPTGNPTEQGWYVLNDGVYTLTEDTTVQEGTTYYVASV